MNTEDTIKKPVVCVMGAGVGGLSAAHQLLKKQYKVIVVERNSTTGGQARSATIDEKHTEYCWHMFSSGYHTLLPILKEIPCNCNREDIAHEYPQCSVFEHLRPLYQYVFYGKGNDMVVDIKTNWMDDFYIFFNNLSRFTKDWNYKDIFYLLRLFFTAQIKGQESMEYLDKIKWVDYTKHFSTGLRNWLVDPMSIYLGMDYNKLSTHLVMDLLKKSNNSYIKNSADFYAFDGPMSDIWFNQWKTYLEEQGVEFYMGHNIVSINTFGENIKDIDIVKLEQDGDFNTKYPKKTIRADYFINSLSVESIAKLTRLRSFNMLANKGFQIQTQILYHFNYRIKEPSTTAYYFYTTPWCLMARHEGSFWDLKNEDYLSVGIGKWDTLGINGKTATQCTDKELAEECWAQILDSNSKFNGPMPEWNLWSSFHFNEKTGELETYEPKFSNNVGCLAYRPQPYDYVYANLYHANAYTRTRMNIFNMESACEAGVRAVECLDEKNKLISQDLKFSVHNELIEINKKYVVVDRNPTGIMYYLSIVERMLSLIFW